MIWYPEDATQEKKKLAPPLGRLLGRLLGRRFAKASPPEAGSAAKGGSGVKSQLTLLVPTYSGHVIR